MSVPAAKWLLVSDIDDTLTGDRAALERLWQALCANVDRVWLALNSSRPAGSVDATLAAEFPTGFAPRAIVTGLGTEIRIDGQWAGEWMEQFCHWPRTSIVELLSGMGFEPHRDEFQTRGKASFAVPGREAAQRADAELSRAGLPCRTIFSGQSDFDVIAPGAGKDAAMLYLARHFGIARQQLVAAGDSGNDLALFNAAGGAIAVGNSRRELIDAMPRDNTYLASEKHAAGVHEGLLALGVLTA